MRKSTMTDLVTELTALNESGKFDAIIAEAKAGEFHDYKNQKYTCGKIALVEALKGHKECESIVRGVMQGDYDETPDEQDKAMMRKEIVDDMGEEAAKPMLKQLGLE